MSYFDELVARYKNMQYGGLSARNPSAIDNVLRTQQGLLGNSLQFGNANQTFIENIPTTEQEFINTPTGRVAQNRFRVGPDGNPIFGVPGQLDGGGSGGGSAGGSGGGSGGSAAYYDSSIDYGDPGYAGVIPGDPDTGNNNVTQTTSGTEKRQGRENREQRNPITHEVINGVAYRINKETGEVEILDGLDEIIANTANTFVSNFTLGGILAGSKSYHDKMKDLKNVSEDAYNAVTANVREQARTKYGQDYDEPTLAQNLKTDFNIAKNWIGGLISGDDDSDNEKNTPTKELSFVNGKAVFTDKSKKTTKTTTPKNVTTTVTKGLISDNNRDPRGGGQGGYRNVPGVSKGRNIHG